MKEENEEEIDPSTSHQRFSQANTFALQVNEAAENLLELTDVLKVKVF